MKSLIKLVGLTVLAVVVGGCSTFDHIQFSVSNAPPLVAVVSDSEIRVPEGVAVIAVATPMSKDGVMDSDTSVELRSADSSVLGVAFALPDGDSGGQNQQWTFVLIGTKVGNTSVSVRVDGVDEKQIPAVVTSQ